MNEAPQTRPAPVTLRDVSLPATTETTMDSTDQAPAGSRAQVATRRLVGGVVTFGLLLAVWILLARSTSPTILPGPDEVWKRFLQSLQDGTYLPALLTTAQEGLLGWSVAAAVALPLGYLVGKFRALEATLAPYLAGSQAMPVVAIAPLLVVWLGFGLLPKVMVCALIAFFPMLATMASGVRGVPTDLRDAARAFGATWLPMALYVDLPLAARTVFAGIKIAAALSVTGAVVGEFVSSDQGLGFLVTFGRDNFDTALMFVATLSLISLGALAYTLVSVIERIVLRWDD